MFAQRQAQVAVIFHHFPTGRHRFQVRRGFGHFRLDRSLPSVRGREKRQRRFPKGLDGPERLAPFQPQRRAEGVGLGQADQAGGGRGRAAPEIVHGGEGTVRPRRRDAGRVSIGEASHHPQAQPHGETTVAGLFEGAVPAAGVDTGGADLDAVFPGVADDLRRGVEAHGLSVQEGGAEDVRVMTLEPGRGIGDQGEGGGVAFRKAVGAEALKLAEGLFRELGRIAALDHAPHQLVLEVADPARELERGHGAAKLVGLGGGEAGAFNGDPHGLLLEEGNAKGLAQHLLQLGPGIVDRLAAFATPQIRMDHVALDGTGPDDGHLDDQIIEGARLDPRQHGHLGAAFDLEDAQGVGLSDHGVGQGVLSRNGRQVEGDALMFGQEIEAAFHAAQHAEGQDVDLHELQGVDVVLVPFDDLAILHRRRLDGNQVVQAVVGKDEAAGVLAKVSREADKLS
ncbi:hypothetical protein D3C85_495960 [compost metagenome]